MPLTAAHAARYADALVALAAATQRPANVVNQGGTYAIRVEFEFNRYLLATNADGDLSTQDDGDDGRWTVRLFARGTGRDELLAEAERDWLVDAFDAVIDAAHASDGKVDDGEVGDGEVDDGEVDDGEVDDGEVGDGPAPGKFPPAPG